MSVDRQHLPAALRQSAPRMVKTFSPEYDTTAIVHLEN
jgi:hypothetical protein